VHDSRFIRYYGNRILQAFFCFAVFLVFLAPLLRLLLMSVTEDAGYGFSHYARLLGEERTRLAVRNTLIVGASSTAFSMLFGATFAFLVAYANLKRRRLAELLILLPFIIPSYIITLSWTGIFSENGAVNGWLSSAGLAPVNLYSLGGIIFVHGMCTIPIVYMIVKAMLRRIPVDLEEASMAAGYSRRQTMLRINLALAAPAVASGGILSFLATIDNFSIPAFLGISSGIPVLSTYIYEKAIGFGPSSFSDAAVLSVLLSLLAVGGTLLEGFFVRRSPGLESTGEDASIRIELPRRTRAWVEWTMLGGLMTFNIVPLLFMFLSAMQKRYGLGYAADNLTVANFRDLLANAGVLRAVRTSILLAGAACAVCIVVGTAAAYLKIRKNNKAAKILEKSAALAYAIPGIVLALAMIFHWVEPLPGVRPGIYGTMTILAVAYVTRYLVLQIKGSVNAMLTVEPALEEAAVAGGSGKIAVWVKILLPLLAKPVLASAFLVFIPAMTELTLSSILSAAGTKTIGLTVFSFQQAGDYSLAAAMSAVVVLLVLGAYGTALLCKKFFERQKEKKNDRTEAGAHIPLVRPDAGAR
jgi:iron(III) transport system permease protein